jgi:hypothetical protein
MPSQPSSSSETPPHEQIAERARKLWMERGSPAGRDLEHWLEAEQQLRDEAGRRKNRSGSKPGKDLDAAERRLDGLIENRPSPARRTPSGENL